ncbi:MAG: hypothetical protein O7D91_08420 [Planctomycetota bacterium]|nr:hypothetical protein [Planctomycetota bacterium]
MTAASLVAELESRGVTIEAAGGELRLDAPAGVLTADMLTTVKSCKAELLSLLMESAKNSKADAEWTRFLLVAKPTPNGLGLYDPSESPEMLSATNGGRCRRRNHKGNGRIPRHPSRHDAGSVAGSTERSVLHRGRHD